MCWAGWRCRLRSLQNSSPGRVTVEARHSGPCLLCLATHEWSQLTEYHPGLRSDEERHVFHLPEDLWLRLTSVGQDTNCELGVRARRMTAVTSSCSLGAALPGWTGVRPQARCGRPGPGHLWILSWN